MEVLPGSYQAVGALLPQGYTRLNLPGYVKADKNAVLPLFGYTSVVWKDGGFHVAAERSDDPERWNPLNCDAKELNVKVEELLAKYPDNRLYKHLSHCALGYECLTASNTFLQRRKEPSRFPIPATQAASAAFPSSRRTARSRLRRPA